MRHRKSTQLIAQPLSATVGNRVGRGTWFLGEVVLYRCNIAQLPRSLHQLDQAKQGLCISNGTSFTCHHLPRLAGIDSRYQLSARPSKSVNEARLLV